jgi:hypothetical protein
MSSSSGKGSLSGKGGDEDTGHHFAERANSLEQVGNLIPSLDCLFSKLDVRFYQSVGSQKAAERVAE